ncbi:MAG: hypothetical protein FJZ63_05695 [Chlamydiae bacterium]|nr:hypothetical protein [Chlamydiota bacterium]
MSSITPTGRQNYEEPNFRSSVRMVRSYLESGNAVKALELAEGIPLANRDVDFEKDLIEKGYFKLGKMEEAKEIIDKS